MDATNATSPTAGYAISGETTRAAAIRRLKKKEQPVELPRPK